MTETTASEPRARAAPRGPDTIALEAVALALGDAVTRLERAIETLTELTASQAASAARDVRVAAPSEPSLLTSRQLQIMALLADGAATDEIAARLWLAPATVRNHVARCLKALGAHSRLQAVARARELGLLP